MHSVLLFGRSQIAPYISCIKLLLTSFLILSSIHPALLAQQSTIDSLRRVLRTEIQDTTRVNALNKLSWELRESAVDTALSLAQEAASLANRIGFRRGESDALHRMGLAYYHNYKYKQAIEYYQQSLKISEALHDTPRIVTVLNSIGNIQKLQGQYESAMRTFQNSLRYAEESGDRRGIADALTGIGSVHSGQERFEQALGYYEKSLTIQEELRDKRSIVGTLNRIGNIQVNEGQFEQALQKHQKALRYSQDLGDKRGIQKTLNFIGITYRALGRDDQALIYYKKSLRIAEELGDKRGEALGFNLLGDLYARRSNYDSAIAMWSSAYVLTKEVGDISLLSSVAHWLSDAYSKQGDFKNAYHYNKVRASLNDSLLNKENLNSINEMSAKYEAEKREQQIALLQKDKELQKVLSYVMICGFVFLLILAAGLYNRYRYRKRTGEELQQSFDQLKRTQQQLIHAEKMATLGELTAGVAHEIKNPLNFITNFSAVNEEVAHEIERHIGGNEDLAEGLSTLITNTRKIREHGRNADSIVNSMLMHSRNTQGVRQESNINDIVREAVELAQHGVPEGTAIELQLQLNENTGKATILPAEISRVVLNLVGNAIYAARRKADADGGAQPQVQVSTTRTGDEIHIRVADNGTGMSDDVKEKIFQPFFSTKPTGIGTGLGLSLCWDIVTNGHNGTIEVESEEGKGATFTVKLPVGG
jgi:two-component system, NtrC family, sensor kinase